MMSKRLARICQDMDQVHAWASSDPKLARIIARRNDLPTEMYEYLCQMCGTNEGVLESLLNNLTVSDEFLLDNVLWEHCCNYQHVDLLQQVHESARPIFCKKIYAKVGRSRWSRHHNLRKAQPWLLIEMWNDPNVDEYDRSYITERCVNCPDWLKVAGTLDIGAL